MGKNNPPSESKFEDPLALRAQLWQEIELAEEKGMPMLPGKRKLATVDNEIAKMKNREIEDLFDTQLNLF
jgi:hypothetical protein